MHGNGTVSTCGGRASALAGSIGGGGGGGGGRIVLSVETVPMLEHVAAYGGSLARNQSEASRGWCQEGGDGTILEIQRQTIVKPSELSHAITSGPAAHEDAGTTRRRLSPLSS
jgi:hypothetical protein